MKVLKDVGIPRSIPTRVGNTKRLLRGDVRMGSIPTRVGNTVSASIAVPAVVVHPHACGEYGNIRDNLGTEEGPSPRVWGILVHRFALSLGPAVHPHACGEYVQFSHHTRYIEGPSPRVWGIQKAVFLSANSNLVHPHACGEYFI